MKSIEINTPAKINIGLNVVSKRDDGFHNLETIFYPIHDLYDTLKFEKAEEYYFSFEHPELIEDDSNLIQKAKVLLEQTTGKELNVKIECRKRIPIGAGLGGGSSDAAAALVGLNKLYKLKIGNRTLANFALELGSDVPFFLNPQPSLGASRGEKLKPVYLKIDFPILLINPSFHISTKEAFQNIIPRRPDMDYELLTQTREIDFSFFKKIIINDFEKNILGKYPEIAAIKNELYHQGAKFALMSGTGSTVYGIFDTLESAKSASDIFPESYFKFISQPAY